MLSIASLDIILFLRFCAWFDISGGHRPYHSPNYHRVRPLQSSPAQQNSRQRDDHGFEKINHLETPSNSNPVLFQHIFTAVGQEYVHFTFQKAL